MSDEEYVANIKNMTDDKLLDGIKYCGHDNYYNVFYYPIIDEIRKRLSEKSERKKGKWIDVTERLGFPECKCSVCQSKSGALWMKFCPNCGADMRGEYADIG